jgi:hypothetical protein
LRRLAGFAGAMTLEMTLAIEDLPSFFVSECFGARSAHRTVSPATPGTTHSKIVNLHFIDVKARFSNPWL